MILLGACSAASLFARVFSQVCQKVLSPPTVASPGRLCVCAANSGVLAQADKGRGRCEGVAGVGTSLPIGQVSPKSAETRADQGIKTSRFAEPARGVSEEFVQSPHGAFRRKCSK